MRLADLFAAIDRVVVGDFGFFNTPSKSEYVVDPRSQTLWDLKPVFGLMLEMSGHKVSGGLKPMTSDALKDQVRAHLPQLGLVSFPQKMSRRLGMRRQERTLPDVDWQGALAQSGLDDAPTTLVMVERPGAVPYYLSQTKVYLRDPDVVLAARDRAQGLCEHCRKPAPFCTSAGWPYLEVHHVTPLSQGGADRLDKVMALCPNCHRQAHFGSTGLG